MGMGKSTFEFTNSSITLDGGSTTINITRDNQSYSHKLSHGYGDIATLAVGTTSYTWTPTAAELADFWEEVPNQKTRQIDVSLYTYNGSTLVGRDIHTLTVTLSDATGKPTLSGFSISDSNSTTNGWGVIVKGVSQLSASSTATGKFGATISSRVYSFDGVDYPSIDALINSMPSLNVAAASKSIVCKVTDSRGFSTSANLSKYVSSYSAPSIDLFEVSRCDEYGAEDSAGTKARVDISGTWAAVSKSGTIKNTATLQVGHKLTSASSYTYQTISVSDGEIDITDTILSATLAASSDYVFSVKLTDALGNVYESNNIPFLNQRDIIYISPDGKQFVIYIPEDGSAVFSPLSARGASDTYSGIINGIPTMQGIYCQANNTPLNCKFQATGTASETSMTATTMTKVPLTSSIASQNYKTYLPDTFFFELSSGKIKCNFSGKILLTASCYFKHSATNGEIGLFINTYPSGSSTKTEVLASIMQVTNYGVYYGAVNAGAKLIEVTNGMTIEMCARFKAGTGSMFPNNSATYVLVEMVERY